MSHPGNAVSVAATTWQDHKYENGIFAGNRFLPWQSVVHLHHARKCGGTNPGFARPPAGRDKILAAVGPASRNEPLNLPSGCRCATSSAHQPAAANLRSGQPQLPSLSDAGAIHGAVWPDGKGLSGGDRFCHGQRLEVTATHPNRMLVDVNGRWRTSRRPCT